MLKKSYKNLRWEEAYYLYCLRENIDYDPDDIEEFLLCDFDSNFDTICKEVRKLSVDMRSDPYYKLTDEYEKLLCNFGTDDWKQHYREKRLKNLLDNEGN